MSILDDAIREHLELKRAHGADEAELKKLEDEAFGPPGRPDEVDPFAEAPTEFMSAPGAEAENGEPAGRDEREDSGRRINVADLQEPPPPEAPVEEEPAAEEPEEPSAMEHEIVEEASSESAPPEGEEPAGPVADTGPSTEERHAIAEQPTEFFDVESEIGPEAEPTVAKPGPTDEEILDEELGEPRIAPGGGIEDAADPVADYEDEEDDEFWSDQRLSDELDQALEAPLEEEPPSEELAAEAPSEEHETVERPEQPREASHDDVLEDTPEFLEDAPEDDELWFEQRPPKDFDFDD